MKLELLRYWLEERGFRIEDNGMANGMNLCKWYAWRKTSGRDCGHNEKPPSLIVYPYKYNLRNICSESVELELTGEFKGVWFKILAYSLDVDDVEKRLDEVEAMLVRMWNAAEEQS